MPKTKGKYERAEKKAALSEESSRFCERSLCGCILLSAVRGLDIAKSGFGIVAGDFDDSLFRRVFETMQELDGRGIPVDPLTLADTKKFSALDIQDIIDNCSTSAHIEYYASRVKQFSRCRDFMRSVQGKASRGEWGNVVMAVQDIARDGLDDISDDSSIDVGEWLESDPAPPDWVCRGAFEKGDRVLVVGSSKTRKSFFVMQMAVSIASGVSFLGMDISSPRRVLLVNLENKKDRQHERVNNMCRSLNIKRESLGGRFRAINGRGNRYDLEYISRIARKHCADVVILDPLYKLDGGADECDMQERKRLIEDLERVTVETGAALVYAHHDAKGISGDRDIRDRGAGSSIINRDVDSTMALTPWGDKDCDNADYLSVLSVLSRNAPPHEDITLEFSNGSFCRNDAIEPVKATSKNVRKPAGNDKDDARELAKMATMGEAVSMKELRSYGREKFGYQRCTRAIECMESAPDLYGVVIWRESKFGRCFVGLASRVGEKLESLGIGFANDKCKGVKP